MSKTHEERTSDEPRHMNAYSVVLHDILQVNDDVRVLQLRKRLREQPIKFLPGQWLDVYVPGIKAAGGFTITSTPQDVTGTDGYVELAIQKAPNNPPAAWLWQDKCRIIGQELLVRIGGTFVWPPPRIDVSKITRVVFVAGGVGINPLISMMTHIQQTNTAPSSIEFLYSARTNATSLNSILFFSRLRENVQKIGCDQCRLSLFLTSTSETREMAGKEVLPEAATRKASLTDSDCERNDASTEKKKRRIQREDLLKALGPTPNLKGVVTYVCGPPAMTDWAVDVLMDAGLPAESVLREKWW